jgi:hypothetical protein
MLRPQLWGSPACRHCRIQFRRFAEDKGLGYLRHPATHSQSGMTRSIAWTLTKVWQADLPKPSKGAPCRKRSKSGEAADRATQRNFMSLLPAHQARPDAEI